MDEWLAKITSFIRKHYRISQTWEPESLENLVVWAAQKEFLVTAYDDGGELVGLAIFWPLDTSRGRDVENVKADGSYDQDGDITYVHLAISTKGKPVLQVLLFGILSRLGNRQFIAFKMFKRAKIKIHTLRKFKDIIFNRGKQHHGKK